MSRIELDTKLSLSKEDFHLDNKQIPSANFQITQSKIAMPKYENLDDVDETLTHSHFKSRNFAFEPEKSVQLQFTERKNLVTENSAEKTESEYKPVSEKIF